jgi:ornithine cyclodeaminase/alanine dehydrogenase-like protein (mu-crystallin family)
MTQMIYLGTDIMPQVASPEEIMDAIEQAYAIETSGAFEMPPRIHIDHKNSTLLYMPCFLDNIFGTKMLTLFPENPAKGKPVLCGLVILNDAESGEPVAILDGAKLTALRTGAVGGVAVRHTTPKNASSVGLIGTGVQGYHQLLFAASARKLTKITVFDLDHNKLKQFCERLSANLPGIIISASKTVEELLDESEIIITATPAEKPVLPDDEKLLQNKSYVGIGSYKPEMREFPRALYNLVDKVIIDTKHGLEESGDLITPLNEGWIERANIIECGKFLNNKGNHGEEVKTRLFKSVGMALFDIVVGNLIYQKAIDNNLGTRLI